jgi:hypothetical protein
LAGNSAPLYLRRVLRVPVRSLILIALQGAPFGAPFLIGVLRERGDAGDAFSSSQKNFQKTLRKPPTVYCGEFEDSQGTLQSSLCGCLATPPHRQIKI